MLKLHDDTQQAIARNAASTTSRSSGSRILLERARQQFQTSEVGHRRTCFFFA